MFKVVVLVVCTFVAVTACAQTGKHRQAESQTQERTMLSDELEHTLNNLFKTAKEKRYESVSVEQLLLALLDNPSALQALHATTDETETLRAQLIAYIAANTPRLDDNANNQNQPTEEMKRVLKRAVFHMQALGKKNVIGVNVLVAIYGERDSHAVSLLNQYATRLDIIDFMSAS